jgi:hypothetical protein
MTLSISYDCDLFSYLYKDLLEFEINTIQCKRIKMTTAYISAVQHFYVLGHNSLMPMEVRAPPHYYYLILLFLLLNTTPTTTNNNNKTRIK